MKSLGTHLMIAGKGEESFFADEASYRCEAVFFSFFFGTLVASGRVCDGCTEWKRGVGAQHSNISSCAHFKDKPQGAAANCRLFPGVGPVLSTKPYYVKALVTSVAADRLDQINYAQASVRNGRCYLNAPKAEFYAT